jgi:hypothetical protein
MQLSHILDGDRGAIERSNLLVWQPAHQSELSIGQKRGTDGKKTTAADWRANRLVDVLAKSAAEMVRANKPTRNLLQSARVACLHAACTLGSVTFAANNHKVEEVDEKGNTRTLTKRDSMDAPPRQQCARSRKQPAAKAEPKAGSEEKRRATDKAAALLLEDPNATKKGRAGAIARSKRARDEDSDITRRIIESRSSQSKPSSAGPAAEIMERLRMRVRLRCVDEQAPESL